MGEWGWTESETIVHLQSALAVGMLAAASYWDIRMRRIPLWLPAACAAAVLPVDGYLLVRQRMHPAGLITALLPGVFFLLFSWMTEGKVGRGDGLMLLALGLCVGAEECAAATAIALLLAALCGVTLLMVRRADRTTKLPFLPFLLIGEGAVLLAGRW